jgi:hypothetical protein
VASGREVAPAAGPAPRRWAGRLDRQSVKTPDTGGAAAVRRPPGQGRPRHRRGEACGLLLAVVGTAASGPERAGAPPVLAVLRPQGCRGWPHMRHALNRETTFLQEMRGRAPPGCGRISICLKRASWRWRQRPNGCATRYSWLRIAVEPILGTSSGQGSCVERVCCAASAL